MKKSKNRTGGCGKRSSQKSKAARAKNITGLFTKLHSKGLSQKIASLANGAFKLAETLTHQSRNPKKELRTLSNCYLKLGIGLIVLGPLVLASVSFMFPNSSPALSITQPLMRFSERSSDPKDPWFYFHPVWEDHGWPLLGTKDPAAPKGPPSFASVIGDPSNHLGNEFQVSDSLFPRVSFWVDVYSRYDSRMKIVHDRHDMSVIYGYLDFRPLYETESNPVRRELKIRRLEEKILKKLGDAINEAAGVVETANLTAEERAALRDLLVKKDADFVKASQSAIENLRTQTGQRDKFLKAIHRSRNFLPHIIGSFKENKLPTILARIPFVESSFNKHAKSKIGAVGMWQFTEDTAQEMISLVDDEDWKDPIKQTSAAVRLLRNYRGALPDWSITITAYNSGIGNLRKAVKKYKALSIDDLLKHPEDNGLGFAGENFYAEVVAATLVESYKNEIFSEWFNDTQLSLAFEEGKIPFF